MVQAQEAMSRGKMHGPGWSNRHPEALSLTHFHHVDLRHSEFGDTAMQPQKHLYAWLLLFPV